MCHLIEWLKSSLSSFSLQLNFDFYVYFERGKTYFACNFCAANCLVIRNEKHKCLWNWLFPSLTSSLDLLVWEECGSGYGVGWAQGCFRGYGLPYHAPESFLHASYRGELKIGLKTVGWKPFWYGLLISCVNNCHENNRGELKIGSIKILGWKPFWQSVVLVILQHVILGCSRGLCMVLQYSFCFGFQSVCWYAASNRAGCLGSWERVLHAQPW